MKSPTHSRLRQFHRGVGGDWPRETLERVGTQRKLDGDESRNRRLGKYSKGGFKSFTHRRKEQVRLGSAARGSSALMARGLSTVFYTRGMRAFCFVDAARSFARDCTSRLERRWHVLFVRNVRLLESPQKVGERREVFGGDFSKIYLRGSVLAPAESLSDQRTFGD